MPIDKIMNFGFLHILGSKLVWLIQEYGATKDSNGLNPFVHKSRCTLCDFIKN
jgi:hypothetical protein